MNCNKLNIVVWNDNSTLFTLRHILYYNLSSNQFCFIQQQFIDVQSVIMLLNKFTLAFNKDQQPKKNLNFKLKSQTINSNDIEDRQILSFVKFSCQSFKIDLIIVFSRMNQSRTNNQQLISCEEYQPLASNHLENHLSVGSFIKSVVYGGMDGVINTTIILLSGLASDTQVPQLFALCFSAIIAGAIDMALCDYVSLKSQIQFIFIEEQRQKYEILHFFQQQKLQMITIYQKKGFSDQDSLRIVELLSTSEQAFLNVMMMEQLGLVKERDLYLPIKCGIATLIAFFTSSFISFSPYVVTWLIQKDNINHPWIAVLIISVIQLISLGSVQAKIIGLVPWKSAVQYLVLGIVATGVGFGIGKFMPK